VEITNKQIDLATFNVGGRKFRRTRKGYEELIRRGIDGSGWVCVSYRSIRRAVHRIITEQMIDDFLDNATKEN